jgi:hypothetical protein
VAELAGAIADRHAALDLSWGVLQRAERAARSFADWIDANHERPRDCSAAALTVDDLEAWRQDASAIVPLHTTAGFWPDDEPNWRLLSLQLGLREYALGQGQSGPVKAPQAHARDLARRRRTVMGGLAEPLARVGRRDGLTGPWRNGLDQRSLTIELTALRAAAYVSSQPSPACGTARYRTSSAVA